MEASFDLPREGGAGLVLADANYVAKGKPKTQRIVLRS
jgi:hypothetical protein